MSRALAQLLGVAEPGLRLQLQRLERAAGVPSADIRLSIEIANQTRDKIRELGLDPHDTTGPELYAALKARLNDDEIRVRKALCLSDATSTVDLLESVKAHLEKLPLRTQTFVVKQSVMRALIILVGSEFWTALDRLVKTYMLNDLHTISPGDEKLYTITDDIFVIQAMIDDHRNKTSALSALAQPAAAA